MREIAKDTDHEAVQGYTQMNKDICYRRCARRWAAIKTRHKAIVREIHGLKRKVRAATA